MIQRFKRWNPAEVKESILELICDGFKLDLLVLYLALCFYAIRISILNQARQRILNLVLVVKYCNASNYMVLLSK